MELNVVFRSLVDTLERGLNNSDAICNFEEMEGDELAGTAVSGPLIPLRKWTHWGAHL